MTRPPRYGTRSLREVLPSVAAALGAPGFDNALAVPTSSQAVVLVVDGLGQRQLEAHADLAGALGVAALEQQPVDAAFPSTTPVGLATLNLAMEPGRHGFVGGTFALPDFDMVLNPLRWRADPPAAAVQPEPTVFSGMRGLDVRSHGPVAYADSGMTRALLADATPVPYAQEGFQANVLDAVPARLDYVYLPELDKVGHVHGPGSRPWREQLVRVAAIVDAIRRRLPSDGVLIVTGDHGMLHVPDDRRIDIDQPALQAGVRQLAGEPRVRHLYTDEPEAVSRRWERHLIDRAHVLTRSEAVAAGLFGPVDDMLEERIGDLVVIAVEDWALTSAAFDPRVSGLTGLHGGLTEAELLVPAVTLRGVAGG